MSLIKNATRNVSLLTKIHASPVLVSANKNVYVNLALEHWLYNNLKFADGQQKCSHPSERILRTPLVLIWTDEPCIVIGRHQNPWIESNLGIINKAGLPLARRHSGGGCVFHDENNINISIIGDRRHFEKRQDNLKFLAQALEKNYGIVCEPTRRHDIVHSDTGLKISGSAAKLGRFNSYHHFTLLVDTNKENLYTVIRQNQQDFIQTNSSHSKRASVINLRELKPDLSVHQVISDLVNEYGKLYGTAKEVPKEQKECYLGDYSGLEDFTKYKTELESWNWIYGKTPKFTLRRELTFMDQGLDRKVEIVVQVNKGLFENIKIEGDIKSENSDISPFDYLIGSKFTYKDAMTNVAKLLQIDERNSDQNINDIGINQLYATYLLRMIHDCNF